MWLLWKASAAGQAAAAGLPTNRLSSCAYSQVWQLPRVLLLNVAGLQCTAMQATQDGQEGWDAGVDAYWRASDMIPEDQEGKWPLVALSFEVLGSEFPGGPGRTRSAGSVMRR